MSTKHLITCTSRHLFCVNKNASYTELSAARPHRVSTVTSSPSLQLQRVHHGVRADRQREDTHHDGITAAGGALRDAAGDTAGHHPQGGRRTLSVR